jgi:outer membrane usher protein
MNKKGRRRPFRTTLFTTLSLIGSARKCALLFAFLYLCSGCHYNNKDSGPSRHRAATLVPRVDHWGQTRGGSGKKDRGAQPPFVRDSIPAAGAAVAAKPRYIEHQTEAKISIPVEIKGETIVDIPSIIRPGEKKTEVFLSTEIISTLGLIITEDLLGRLRRAVIRIDGGLYLPTQALVDNGLSVLFDEQAIRLIIDLSQDKKSVKTIAVREKPVRHEFDPEHDVHQAQFSTFLNWELDEQFSNQQSVQNGTTANQYGPGRQPLIARLNGAVNIDTLVLETQDTVKENSGFVRGETRLIKDSPTGLYRYSLGDLSTQQTNLSHSHDMGGFSVSNLEDHARTRYNIAPIGNYAFALRQRARVRVLNDKREVASYVLPVGQYDIRDFPETLGYNKIILEIKYDDGVIESVPIGSFLYSGKIIKMGSYEFAYSAGIIRTQSDTGFSYYKDLPVASVFHRYGLLNDLTMAHSLSLFKNYSENTLTTTLSTPFGVLSNEIGELYSSDQHDAQPHGLGLADTISYEISGDSDSILSTYTHRSTDYQVLNELTLRLSNPSFVLLQENSSGGNFNAKNDAGASYTRRWSPSLANNLSIHYAFSGENRTLWTSLSTHKKWSHAFDSYLTFSRASGLVNQSSEIVGIVGMTFKLGSVVASSSLSSKDDATQTSVAYSENNKSASVQYNRSNNGNNSVSATGSLTKQSYEVITNAASYGNSASTTSSKSASVSVKSGIAYAEGQVSVAKTLNESFAIIKPEDEASHYRMLINEYNVNQSDKNKDDKNFLGNSMVTGLRPFTSSEVMANMPDLPLGENLEKENFRFFPTYKSGATVRVKIKSAISVTGRLIKNDGKTWAHASGKFDIEGVSNLFFTDDDGLFTIEGIKPGETYMITLFNENDSILKIRSEPTQRGLVNIGTVKEEQRTNK